MYKYFSEFWANHGRPFQLWDAKEARRIALMAWNAATTSLTMDTFSNSEIYTEAVIRGFEVRRTDKSDGGNNE